MDEIVGGKALIYRSDGIYERRRRILREARRMIAASGLANFSVRELCARAEIAQKTLYNAFGSKENVIALAIRQYLEEFSETSVYRSDPATLEGRLERLVKVHSRNIQIRPYTTAIMAVYASPTAPRAVREVIRNVSRTEIEPYVLRLSGEGALAHGLAAGDVSDRLTTAVYAVLTEWCLGDLGDEALVDRISDAFLVVAVGCTAGAARQEAEAWLEALRGRRPAWLALRRTAEVAPRGSRAAATARRKSS